MKKLLIATKNPGKLKELSAFLQKFETVSLSDVGIDDDVEETGKTFEENSKLKAIFYAKKSGLPTLSDDGGLEIDALDGEPGVRSRRWLGYEASDDELKNHLKKVIERLPKNKRSARFTTVLSFAVPDGRVWSERAEVVGELSTNTRGKDLKGYPYRSYFYLPEIKKFYHESDLSESEIEQFNHRHKALSKILPIISDHL